MCLRATIFVIARLATHGTSNFARKWARRTVVAELRHPVFETTLVNSIIRREFNRNRRPSSIRPDYLAA